MARRKTKYDKFIRALEITMADEAFYYFDYFDDYDYYDYFEYDNDNDVENTEDYHVEIGEFDYCCRGSYRKVNIDYYRSPAQRRQSKIDKILGLEIDLKRETLADYFRE